MPPFVCPLDHDWWPFKKIPMSGLWTLWYWVDVHIGQSIGFKYIWDVCVCDISPFLWWRNWKTKSKSSYVCTTHAWNQRVIQFVGMHRDSHSIHILLFCCPLITFLENKIQLHMFESRIIWSVGIRCAWIMMFILLTCLLFCSLISARVKSLER